MNYDFLRPQQDESRRDETGVVKLIELGRVDCPYWVAREGRVFNKFMVLATQYNREWPGSGSDVTFVVEGWGQKDQFYGPLFLWGFHTEQECYDFLTGRGPKNYDSWDLQGNPITSIRERLGLPDSWVTRYIASADC